MTVLTGPGGFAPPTDGGPDDPESGPESRLKDPLAGPLFNNPPAGPLFRMPLGGPLLNTPLCGPLFRMPLGGPLFNTPLCGPLLRIPVWGPDILTLGGPLVLVSGVSKGSGSNEAAGAGRWVDGCVVGVAPGVGTEIGPDRVVVAAASLAAMDSESAFEPRDDGGKEPVRGLGCEAISVSRRASAVASAGRSAGDLDRQAARRSA